MCKDHFFFKLKGKWKIVNPAPNFEIKIQFIDKNPTFQFNAIYSESIILFSKRLQKTVIPISADISRNGRYLRFRYSNSSKIEIFKIDHLDSISIKMSEIQSGSKFELQRNE